MGAKEQGRKGTQEKVQSLKFQWGLRSGLSERAASPLDRQGTPSRLPSSAGILEKMLPKTPPGYPLFFFFLTTHTTLYFPQLLLQKQDLE